ncbi:MAG: AsmA-like C-terminal region-containing protein [Vicinamibacteria bacterium]
MAGPGSSSIPYATRGRLLLLAGIALALLGLGLAYVAHLVRSLDTPAFHQALLARASAAVGTRVQARKVSVSLLRGVTLEGVTIANPPPFKGPLLTADALVLRYDLSSLLRGRLEVARLSAEKPVLDLAMDQRGVFNYEKLAAARATNASAGPAALPVELAISKLSLDGARIVMRDPRAALMKVEGAELDSSVRLAQGSVEGDGKLRVGLLNLADAFFVRDVSAPLHASGGGLKLAPVRATLAGGSVGGEVDLRFQQGFRFVATLNVKGAQLRTLLAEAGAAQGMSGTLVGDAVVEGTGGVATLKGKGRVEVQDCRVTHAPLMTLLSNVLRIPELARPDFDECGGTFTLGAGRLVNPTLAFKGPTVQLTGHGATRLANLSIDYDMTLALSQTLARRIPAEELRAAFRDRGDGFVTIDFEVTGTTSSPQSDLALRVGRAAAESGLRKLLRRRFF